nr:ATP-binding protein [Lachnotalea glycerini]
MKSCSSDTSLILIIADNGIGLSAEKLQELEEKPHYMNSTDERLDLRHGLGLLLVRQIVEVHEGTMQINSVANHFPLAFVRIVFLFHRNQYFYTLPQKGLSYERKKLWKNFHSSNKCIYCCVWKTNNHLWV